MLMLHTEQTEMGEFPFSYSICRYKLYQFLVTDGMGYGRPVMYAFVKSERYASLRTLFLTFREMMCKGSTVHTFVMDKMASQMRAARVVFGCDILLCYFHAVGALSLIHI
jgi:hypothetical protein